MRNCVPCIANVCPCVLYCITVLHYSVCMYRQGCMYLNVASVHVCAMLLFIVCTYFYVASFMSKINLPCHKSNILESWVRHGNVQFVVLPTNYMETATANTAQHFASSLFIQSVAFTWQFTSCLLSPCHTPAQSLCDMGVLANCQTYIQCQKGLCGGGFRCFTNFTEAPLTRPWSC